MKRLTLLIAATLLVASAGAADASKCRHGHGDDTNPGAAVADALIVRPASLGVSLATTAVYLGTVPLTFLIDVDEPAGKYLVTLPWWFTSGRDLGKFDARYKSGCRKRCPCKAG